MKTYYAITLFIFLLSPLLFAQNNEKLTTEIRLKVEAIQGALHSSVQGEVICCGKTVPLFYHERFFKPAWDAYLGAELISALEDSENEGLQPADYHLEALKALAQLKEMTDFERRDFDLLLTDAFLLLSSHLMSGKVDPKEIDSQWKTIRREGDPVKILNAALESRNIRGSLEDLKPGFKAYNRLKERLLSYRKIKEDGGWESIADGPTLKLNMEDDRVVALRKRLRSTRDLLSYTVEDLRLYDDELVAAVKAYQRRHGLHPDGNVGKETLASLNTPVEERIKQIKINMERCRWLPQELGSQYIMVNLPAFELEVVSEGQVELEMIVAVGKPYRQTPVFSSRMTYVVFNPYWTVPPTILAQDILPAQAKNPNYLNNLNIKIIGRDGSMVPTSQIDWAKISAKSFPYTLRQEPGPNNALGEVKFIFPNEYNIYMHDTNHRELFVKSERALSSGCIRLSKPMDMANYLLSKDQGISADKITDIVKTRQNHTIVLKKPVQVHLQYWTAFVDEKGVLNFRKDIYSRDERLLQALQHEAPRT